MRQLEHATFLQQQYHQHTEVSCSLYETAKLFIECQTIGTKVPKETEDLFKVGYWSKFQIPQFLVDFGESWHTDRNLYADFKSVIKIPVS